MQKTKFLKVFSLWEIKFSSLLLLWVLGLTLGALAGMFSTCNVFWLSRAFITPASIVSLILCAFFPSVFTACAILFKKSYLI